METPAKPGRASINSNQTAQLYNTLRYSAVGNITGALILSVVIAPKTDALVVWSWFTATLFVSLYRSVFSYNNYRRHIDDRPDSSWRLRFKLGAFMTAIAWSSSMWLFYPVAYP